MPLICQHDYWICCLSAAESELFLSTYKTLMCFYSGLHQRHVRDLHNAAIEVHDSPLLSRDHFSWLDFFSPPQKTFAFSSSAQLNTAISLFCRHDHSYRESMLGRRRKKKDKSRASLMMQVKCTDSKRELWTKAVMEIQADAGSYTNTQSLSRLFSSLQSVIRALLFCSTF